MSRAFARCARAVILIVAMVLLARVARAQIELPPGKLSDRITAAADSSSHWVEGSYDVYLLRGNCYINQGLTYARSREAVLWIERGGPGGEPPHKVISYLEGEVEINAQSADAVRKAAGAATLKDKSWFGRFYSAYPVDVKPGQLTPPPPNKPEVYQHATAALAGTPITPGVKQAQFAEPIAAPPPIVGPPPGMLRVRVQARSGVPMELETYVTTPPQTVAVAKGGINIIVDGIDQFGSIDVDTDNLVIWTEGGLQTDSEGQAVQSRDRPLELYLEGNIVFRQGERTIYAQRMYYDVRRQTGIVLGAEILTPIPTYEGLIKLRADAIQQVGPDRFLAHNASLTTSRLGLPTYELRSELMTYDDIQQPRINPFTGTPEVDPTGGPIIDHSKLATSRGNTVYVEQFPVFYWPLFASDLERPTLFVEAVNVRNDRVFGTQILTDLDAYQLFGIRNPPKGTRWILSADYLSERGFGGGTTFNYERQTFWGMPEATSGFLDAWAIKDHGNDNLGFDRRDIPPEKDFRGRVLWQHRQLLPNNFQLTAEVGLISDFNFLEQYFEREWDQLKDQTTDVEIKQFLDNSTWSGYASVRLNPFFTETEWLPRLDHYWLGQPLLNDRLTWYEHSSIGYARFKSAEPPTDPTQAAHWGPLPWETPADSTHLGERVATRHEIDFPFELGVVKFNPYLLGELAHWGEALDFSSQDRAYGAAGIRASLPMWSVNPMIEDQLFNVHGLAHKATWQTDIFYAASSSHLDTLPLYDQIDDNNIEAYRRWFPFDDFGGPPPVPPQFDERFYALRRGLGQWVASPSTEIADELFVARLGLEQRWQTKRGPLANRRTIDWIVLNTDATFFPDPNRDNFGQVIGLVDVNFRWHVGDRTTIVSDSYFDFFDSAPKYFNVGAFLNRPPRGSLYVGLRSLEGPINSTVLATSYSYRMSPKWISTFGTTYDLAESRNIGQNFTLTRIGESFLVTMNVNVDTSKNNIGASIAIVPRFLQGRLGPQAAVVTPVAGLYGIE